MQLEEEIQSEVELIEHRWLTQKIIKRMVKDRVILEHRPSEDPMRPELRVLSMHATVRVGQDVEAQLCDGSGCGQVKPRLRALTGLHPWPILRAAAGGE